MWATFALFVIFAALMGSIGLLELKAHHRRRHDKARIEKRSSELANVAARRVRARYGSSPEAKAIIDSLDGTDSPRGRKGKKA